MHVVAAGAASVAKRKSLPSLRVCVFVWKTRAPVCVCVWWRRPNSIVRASLLFCLAVWSCVSSWWCVPPTPPISPAYLSVFQHNRFQNIHTYRAQAQCQSNIVIHIRVVCSYTIVLPTRFLANETSKKLMTFIICADYVWARAHAVYIPWVRVCVRLACEPCGFMYIDIFCYTLRDIFGDYLFFVFFFFGSVFVWKIMPEYG